MQRILVMYATREGQTAKIAARVAQRLRDAGKDVTLLDASAAEVATVDLADFGLLVFGASMHAGGLERELVEFVNARADLIGAMPRAFFLVLLSAATRDPALREKWLADARARLTSQLVVTFDTVETIAGALRYSAYSPPMKWVMRRIAAKAGGDTDTRRDYEYTDWQQVDDFAQRLAARR
jgi:menaquinone-dependent protoporphyrinogen oxidase